MSDDRTPRDGLGALLAAKGLRSSGTAETPPAAPAAAAPRVWTVADAEKVVVRLERKGHGGKTVTCLGGLAGAPADALDALARSLRTALGLGVRVEDGEVVVQGDQRDRLRAWLTKQGARRVVG
jgi:translation initiation factor 1